MSFTSFFKAVSTDVHNFLVKVFGQDAISKFESDLKSLLQEDIFVVFTDAVQAAQTLTLGGSAADGASKRAAAFTQVVTDLKSKGITLGESVVNMGIELAVNLLKSKTPA